jgi:hypothetical protein
MDAKTLAALLDGVTYGEFPKDVGARAKAAGLLVVTGYSDDGVEFLGAFRDEASAGEVRFDRDGIVPSREAMEGADDDEIEAWIARKRASSVLHATFGVPGEPDWTYRTDVPHETFTVVDEGTRYARGMVIALSDLPGA